MTVGMDAQIRQLQAELLKQISGGSGVIDDKDDEESLVSKLEGAMADKQRSLLVLDDPWMAQQVRFLNPIDEPSTSHRLLVTTRIRDLVRRAALVELPLMGKDEAVALLLDLADIDKAGYLKQNPGTEFPPKAAYDIASACGLLPITLSIAAQMVKVSE